MSFAIRKGVPARMSTSRSKQRGRQEGVVFCRWPAMPAGKTV